MTSQINRRNIRPRLTDDESRGAERFGVHTFGGFLKQERLSHSISRTMMAAKTNIATAPRPLTTTRFASARGRRRFT